MVPTFLFLDTLYTKMRAWGRGVSALFQGPVSVERGTTEYEIENRDGIYASRELGVGSHAHHIHAEETDRDAYHSVIS